MSTLIRSLIGLLLCFAVSASAQNIVKSPHLNIHPEFLEKVSEARQLGLAAVNTQIFASDLSRFYEDYGHTDKVPTWSGFKRNHLNLYNEAWAKKPLEEIIREVRIQSPMLSVKSKGGINQRRRYIFAGNIADEPENGGPIILNKYALAQRSKSSIAGSIIHEGAHKVGLRHDNYSSFKRLGKCEPPYVINQLIERIIEGEDWKYDQYDCELLSDWSALQVSSK